MAKTTKTEATKQEESAALATTASNALALVQADELAGVFEDGDASFDVDGLGEVDASDVKLAAKVFNFKGTDAAGDPIPPNVFFDTVSETTSKTLNVALVDLKKSNEWREFDVSENQTKIRCRSFDRVTGEMDDGKQRKCHNCPDAQWRTDPSTGKRTRRCGPVYNVLVVDRETALPAVVRFKRTSLPVIQAHLNKHHLGKRIVGGKRGNYPLFVFAAQLSLKMSDDKKYALPVIDRGPVLSRAEIESHAETARAWRELFGRQLEQIEKADVADTPDAIETTAVNSEDFRDDGAESTDPNRNF